MVPRKGAPATVAAVRGRVPVQLHFPTGLSSKDYVRTKAWVKASLPSCPLHPQGGCGFSRHGSYERVWPQGARVARWYCPRGRTTFSLLPDCLAARFTGSLTAVEAVVAAAQVGPSVEHAASELGSIDITLISAVRWVRRRLQGVVRALAALVGLYPDRFSSCQPTVADFRQALSVRWVLPALREVAAAHLTYLPAPIGFAPRKKRGQAPVRATPHEVGPDP